MKVKKKSKEEKFHEMIIRNRKKMDKVLNPRIDYDEEYDIFYICWGNKKVYSTIETSNGIMFDVTRNGTIVGIEIEDLKEKLKKEKK